MNQNYDFSIEKIKNLSKEERNFRQKNLDLFLEQGFPNKNLEDWKFTDFNSILNKNFENINNRHEHNFNKKLETIKKIEHNYIFLIDGKINSSSFKHEEENKILLKNYSEKSTIKIDAKNSLHFLNNALFSWGFNLEVSKNYKFKKPLIIYNFFSDNLENIILNDKNSIKLNEDSQLTLIEYN